jgi:hypothetical protein
MPNETIPFGFGTIGASSLRGLSRRGAPLWAHWRRKYAGSVARLINENPDWSNVEIARAIIEVCRSKEERAPAERTVENWVSKIRNSIV